MDAAYIAALCRAAEKVFATMLQTRVEVMSPHLKRVGEPRLDVSGIIGLTGDVTGAVILSFPMDTARRVVSLFTGMDMGPEHEDFADAVGELVNMVAGNAKAEFVGKKVSISCPSVIVGEQHQVLLQKDALAVEIPCKCECGTFIIEVTIKEMGAANATSQPAVAHA